MQPLFFSLLLASASASVVTNLTSASFNDFITSNELSLISFVVDYCEYCHELYPEYEAAAETSQANNWPFARINCQVDKALCQEYRVPIYPTIHVFHGEEYSIYNGKRSADAMVSLMKRHSQPVVTVLNTAQKAADFSIQDEVTIIGHYDANDTMSSEAFKTLAEKRRDDYLFGFTSDEAFGSAEKVKKPALVMYKAFDEGRAVYEGSFDLDAIETWARSMATPYIREIGIDLNYAGSERVPLAIMFANNQDQRDALVKALWPVAEITQKELLWIIVDPERYPEHASRVALVPGEWPAFGIEDLPNNFKFAFSRRGSVKHLNQAAIRRVVDDFLNEKLTSSENLIGSQDMIENFTNPAPELELPSQGQWKVKRDEL